MTNLELISSARAFALEKHDGLFRKNRSREPYAVHVTQVAGLIERSGGSAEEIAAGLLHDTREDTPTTDAELRERFGNAVADLVDGLTDPEEYLGMPLLPRKTLQAERLRGKSDSVKRCKLADGISNVESVATDPPADWERQQCLDYVEGARLVASECVGISPYLDERFRAAHAAAISAIDRFFPVVT